VNAANDMGIAFRTYSVRRGLSLAEMLAALLIGSMLLIALLGLYSRAERATAAVNRKLDSSRLPGEILQRIAEDIDKLISPGSETRITIENKLRKGYPAAKLTVVRTITDSKNQERILEEIIWQSSTDIESDMEGLVLYRGHSGIMLEDKLLDEQRADWEKDYPMVPICSGVMFFEILVPSGENFLKKWTGNSLPKGIAVSISFTEPVKSPTGDYEVADEYKTTRTMAIDRTRRINFELAPLESEMGTNSGQASRI